MSVLSLNPLNNAHTHTQTDMHAQAHTQNTFSSLYEISMKGENAIKSTAEIGHVLFLKSDSSRQQFLKQAVSCLCGAADRDSLEKRYVICQQVLHTWQDYYKCNYPQPIHLLKCFDCVFIFL